MKRNKVINFFHGNIDIGYAISLDMSRIPTIISNSTLQTGKEVYLPCGRKRKLKKIKKHKLKKRRKRDRHKKKLR